MTNARLVVLILAPAQWLLLWTAGYLRLLPIGKSLRAGLTSLAGVSALLGVWIIQGKIYYSLTGIGVPMSDHYFSAIVIGETIVSIGLVFLIALEIRRKEAGRAQE
jgi:hypothetical protein